MPRVQRHLAAKDSWNSNVVRKQRVEKTVNPGRGAAFCLLTLCFNLNRLRTVARAGQMAGIQADMRVFGSRQFSLFLTLTSQSRTNMAWTAFRASWRQAAYRHTGKNFLKARGANESKRMTGDKGGIHCLSQLLSRRQCTLVTPDQGTHCVKTLSCLCASHVHQVYRTDGSLGTVYGSIDDVFYRPRYQLASISIPYDCKVTGLHFFHDTVVFLSLLVMRLSRS